MYIGVDQSYTSCAFVLVDQLSLVDYGVYKSDKTKSIYQRSRDVAQYVLDTWHVSKLPLLVLEGLAFGMRGDATRDLAGLQFTIINALSAVSKPPIVGIVSPTTLKKYATGTGKSKKADMIAALPESVRNSFIEQGFKKTTGLGDLADAYWLAMYAQENSAQLIEKHK